MDNRDLLELPVVSDPVNPISDLTPYAGPWEFAQAGHLLRRACFGPITEEIEEAVLLGLEGTLGELFAAAPAPEPPMNHYFQEDPFVAVGESWLGAPLSAEVNLLVYRGQSLRAWILQNLLNEGIGIREKLVLFWHNHFAVTGVADGNFQYRYLNLLKDFAWGNFRELVKEVNIDPAMLRFLNGNQNTEKAPNENYARELLELYTVGKGDLAGPGDYSTFTEDDVIEMARVLTGWRDRGYRSENPEVKMDIEYLAERHDKGPKQLSHRFNHTVIENREEDEHRHLIDVIFEQDMTVARHLCTKLYRWFVYYEVSTEVQEIVIDPLSQILIDNDFEIRPVVETLLRSQHFFDILNQGPMIKNPIDFVVSSIRQTYAVLPPDLNERYTILYRLFQASGPMQMDYLAPHSVSGWYPYYQAPAYSRLWINATTMRSRMNHASRLSHAGVKFSGIRIQADPFRMMTNIEDPLDPNLVVRGFAEGLCPLPLAEHQLAALKEILIPGLPDFEWTVEFGQYLENNEDPDLARSIEQKLRSLTEAILTMAEFHLS